MKRISSLFLILAAALLAGSGCQKPDLRSLFSSETTSSTYATMTPEQAASRLQFISGDTFEIRQTFLGFGAFLADLTKSTDGIRYVQIEQFAPLQGAALKWMLSAERPASNGAMEKVSTSGTVINIDLKTSHSLFPPSFWKDGQNDTLHQTSAIWLSDDAFNELTRTHKTTLNFDVFGESASQIVKNITELKSALAKLQQQATLEGQHKDLNLLEADAEPVMWPLKINGVEVQVSAIKAHNWFGEVVILNNRQNPLVLKLTINPLFPKNIFGYEITNLVVSGM